MRIFRIMLIHEDTPLENREPRGLVEEALTGKVIGAFYAVYNELRFGFLESVYAGALEMEFAERGLPHIREYPLAVAYHERVVGTYRADFLIAGKMIVEVKASLALSDADRSQLRHYLKATRVEVGLLLHFGPKARFYRMQHSVGS